MKKTSGKLLKQIDALERTLHYHLATMYLNVNAWSITAWEIERLAEEPLPDRYLATVRMLRQNLYAYISSLGAEWPAEEENTILLPGSYNEAAKALKALWLSLHLVLLTPVEQPKQLPPIEEIYTVYTAYTRILREAQGYKPLPFKLADRLLTVAAMVSLSTGRAEPSDYERLGVAQIVADILWALSKAYTPKQ